MKKSAAKLASMLVFIAALISFGRIAVGQGTENLPIGTQTKDYQMLGAPPSLDPDPAVNPNSNPVTGPGSTVPSLTVPEPTTIALLLAGAGFLAGMACRRRQS